MQAAHPHSNAECIQQAAITGQHQRIYAEYPAGPARHNGKRSEVQSTPCAHLIASHFILSSTDLVELCLLISSGSQGTDRLSVQTR